MKIIELIKGLFHTKKSYIVIHYDNTKKNVKPLDMIQKDNELKKVKFIPMDAHPGYLFSENISSLKELSELTLIKIYKATKNGIIHMDTHSQDYLMILDNLKNWFISVEQITKSQDSSQNIEEEQKNKLLGEYKDEGHINSNETEEQGTLHDTYGKTGEEETLNSDETQEKGEGAESKEEMDYSKMLDFVKVELAKFKENELNDLQVEIRQNSDGIEALKGNFWGRNQIKELVSNILAIELNNYVTEKKFLTEITNKLQRYALNSVLEQIKSLIEVNKSELINLKKDVKSIEETKVDSKLIDEIQSKIEILNESNEKIISVYQSSKEGKLQAKLNKLETELIEAQDKLEKSENALSDSIRTTENIKKDNANKDKQIESLKETLEDKQETILGQKKELKGIKTDLQTKNKALASATTKIEEQETIILDSKKVIADQESTIKKNQEEIENKEKRLNEQNLRITDLEKENGNLERDLQTQREVNGDLQKTMTNDNDKIKNDFTSALSSIKDILEEKGFIIPCGDNVDDCEELEDMLEVKVNKFYNHISTGISECKSLSLSIRFFTESIENELLNERSWIYDIARYRAYSRKRFMKDEDREHGVRFEKSKIVLMWENLNKMLSMLNFSLIMPDLFEDSISENDEYEDNTGKTISNLDFLIPNNDKYLAEISNNDGKIIRDYAEIGYKYNGKVIKVTKIIR